MSNCLIFIFLRAKITKFAEYIGIQLSIFNYEPTIFYRLYIK